MSARQTRKNPKNSIFASSKYFASRHPNKSLWRYMGFSKFMSLLLTGSLHFSRLDQLEDEYEGRYPGDWKLRPPSIPFDKEMSALLVKLRGFKPGSKEGRQHIKQFKDSMSQENREHEEELYRTHTLVNCWSAQTEESHAMWRVFLGNEPGVAVRTTVSRLMDSIDGQMAESEEDYNTPLIVGISPVWYSGKKPPTDDIPPHSFKRKYFAYEKEVRLTIYMGIEAEDIEQTSTPISRDVSVDLEKLIVDVRVDPTAPKWFFDTVKLAIDTLGPVKPVLLSEMT